MTQNDQAVQLAAGDVVLVDAARPMTYFRNDTGAQWLSVRLPRRFRVSHLGFEPQGGSCRRGGTPARRLLFSLVHDLDTDSGLQIRVCRFLHGAGCLRSRRRAICAVRSPAHHSPSGQAVRAYLRRDQGRLFRSGFWARRGGRRSGNLVTLPSEALYGARFHLQRVHLIRFVWTTPHVFYAGARCWVPSLSARSPTPAAFAIMHMSRGNSAIGLVTRRAPMSHMDKAPVME
jgi:hypothetical protein